MVLMDLSQLFVAAFMAVAGYGKSNIEITEESVRHLTLNTIRANRLKFKEYGDLVICCDSPLSWRRDFFPYYKARRRQNKEKSTVNWKQLYATLHKIIEELREYLPYRVIMVDGCEGDDVIGVMTKYLNDDEDPHSWFNCAKTLIISGDHDFSQLQIYPNVLRFDPVHKHFIKEPEPLQFLAEHIIRGDVGDGVPNILSSDDCLVNHQRQSPITKKRLEALIKHVPEEIEVNWNRNNTLVNLANTPIDLVDKIIVEYKKEAGKDRTRLLEYFMTFRLRELTKSINDF